MPRPYAGKEITCQNPDGTRFQARVWGNQHYAVLETLDGYTIVKNPADGFYEYGSLSADQNDMVPSGVRVGDPSRAQLRLPQHARVRPEASKAKALRAVSQMPGRPRWQVRRERQQMDARRSMSTSLGAAPPSGQTVGNYVGLCIIIQFPDVPGSISQQEVQSFCNQPGYSSFGNNGSVYDYFVDVSAGRLHYTNVVTAYYTAQQNRAYYTDNTIPYGTRARELIVEALEHLRGAGFDFSALSSDGGGYVYALNVFYAGDAVNNWAEGLWPHAWALEAPYETGAGNRLSDYQITNMGSQLTLGTFCHENGHMLCDFPDLYDYGGQSAGVGDYCLMCYGGPDTNPTQVGAYLKYKAGWATQLTPITPGLAATVTGGTNGFFIHQKNPTEYFIIENRQQQGRDAGLPDAGLAIWHIDETGNNENEQMLPAQHYECSIEQADGRSDLERFMNLGDGDDLFSAPTKASFGDATTPSSKWWDGTASGLEIEQISASGAVMTFATAGQQYQWSGWVSEGGVLTGNPAVASNADGRLEVFTRGTDNALWHKWQVAANGSWSNWASEGGMLTSNVAVGRNANGRLEAFVRGTDNTLWHKWQLSPSGPWSTWTSEGGVLTSELAVGQNLDGRLEVFVRGMDNALWHKWQVAPNGGWSNWASEGGVLTSNVAVGRNADGRMEVFARGTDGALWRKAQVTPNGGWSEWASEGGVLVGDVAVGQNADGRLEVFVRGNDGALWHKWQLSPGGVWSGWASEGGVLTSDVAVERNADGRLEVFVRGSDNALWHKWQVTPSGAWSGWKSEGGLLTSEIAVGKHQDGRLAVFVRGTDGALWQNSQTSLVAQPAPVPRRPLASAKPAAVAAAPAS